MFFPLPLKASKMVWGHMEKSVAFLNLRQWSEGPRSLLSELKVELVWPVTSQPGLPVPLIVFWIAGLQEASRGPEASLSLDLYRNLRDKEMKRLDYLPVNGEGRQVCWGRETTQGVHTQMSIFINCLAI